jgi:hypothetical protein
MNADPTRASFIRDIIITAVEGGTGYWALVHDYKPDKGYAVLQEFDESTGEGVGSRLRLDADSVEEGIRRITHGLTSLNSSWVCAVAGWDATNDSLPIDADAADLITQVALLGDVVYA